MIRSASGFLVFMLLLATPAAAQDDVAACTDKDHRQALEACTRLLDHPDAPPDFRAQVFAVRAGHWSRRGQSDRALADYDASIRIDATQVGVHLMRGNIHDARGDVDAAIADYTTAIRLDPAFELAYINRCDSLANKNEVERALDDCNTAVRLNPKNWMAYNNRAAALQRKGDHDRALADLDAAVTLDAGQPLLHGSRGFALLAKRDFARAIAAYDEAIRLDPTSARLHFQRAIAHVYGGSPAAALADIRRAADGSAGTHDVALWLDLIGQRNGQPGRLSQTAAARGSDTRWPAPIVDLMLGRTTLDAMLKAAAAEPDPRQSLCSAHVHGAMWSVRQGDRPEATRLLRLAVDGCPRHVMDWLIAREELGRLAERR